MCLLIFINIQQEKYNLYGNKNILAGCPKEVACDVVSLVWGKNNYIILKIAKAIDFQFYSYLWKITKEKNALKRKTSLPTTFDLWIKQLE